MNKRSNIFLVIIVISLATSSCKKYLDIVPDNIPSVEKAFSLEESARKYLYTCYSFIPIRYGSTIFNSLLLTSDELDGGKLYPGQWATSYGTEILMGNQNVNDPYMNFWDARMGGGSLWNGIRECDIFLDNVGNVPNVDITKKQQWAAEVKFLKAYYYFYLLRMYGPIPIIRQKITAFTPLEEMQMERQPVDSVFDYIIKLLDESAQEGLWMNVDANNKLGRITIPINRAIKAKVMVYRASPLFNGNTDYRNFLNKNNEPFFNQTYDESKWTDAMDACKEAIDVCEQNGYELYEFQSALGLSDRTMTEMNLRNSINDKWNDEIIWGNASNTGRLMQTYSMPRFLDSRAGSNPLPLAYISVTLNFSKLFYTNNGLPIDQDKDWDYTNRMNIRTATADDAHYIQNGYNTVGLNFDREPRYYADLSFDGGIWYGNGIYTETDNYYLMNKRGQLSNDPNDLGIYAKKFVHYQSVVNSPSGGNVENYPWPMMRLADLYLLCAEAANEAGNRDMAIDYLNLVRARAGIPDVKTAWDSHSYSPQKYSIREGLREIIQRERSLELAFEGDRLWDLRRWKTAEDYLRGPVLGWDTSQESEELYYRETQFRTKKFEFRDYFQPIRQYNLQTNPNLVQNPGW